MPQTKRSYQEQSRDLTNSLILTAPLLVLYEAGLLLLDFSGLNGVDLFTVLVLRHAGLRGLILLNLGILAAIAIASHVREKERAFDPSIAPFVVVESTVYALVLGFAIVSVMRHLPFNPAAQAGGRGYGVLHAIVASLGAGVNEELFFRLGLFNVIAFVAARGRPERTPFAVAVGVLLSSVAFSLAHYGGAEAFQVYSFVYRIFAGMLFCAIYLGRGLAVAVYTHAIYDIIVLTLREG